MVRALYYFFQLLYAIVTIIFIISSPVLGVRELMLFVSYIVFFNITQLYYKKRQSMTVGFFFYIFVIYTAFNLSSYNFIYNTHIQSVNTQLVTIPKYDHYPLSFCVFIVVSCLIWVYLMLSKKEEGSVLSPVFPRLSIRSLGILYSIIILLYIMHLIFGFYSYIILIPTFVYLVLSLTTSKLNRYSKRYIPAYIYILLILVTFLKHRYIILQFLFPLILFYLLNIPNNKFKRVYFLKYLVVFVSITVVLSIYGVFSEIYKLNSRFGTTYGMDEILNIFSNFDLLVYWASRQLYRIFSIWSHLGGNIIEYVDQHGYFYGLTYIKFLAPILGITYVSLPIISAKLISASYAQPGLLAEGYANFGIIGSIINIFMTFIIIDLLYKYYVRKKSLFCLILIIVPFTQVILDGGSINSIIALSFMTILSLYFLRRIKFEYR